MSSYLISDPISAIDFNARPIIVRRIWLRSLLWYDRSQPCDVQSGSPRMASPVGEEFTDTVTLGDLVLTEQSIGVAELAFGFDGVDGILGYALSIHNASCD